MQVDAQQRGRVLGPRFMEALREFAGRIDLVCLTGDIADWGHPDEYAKASQRLAPMLKVLNVGRHQFFAVPGNHDVQRNIAEDAWRGLRRWLAQTHDASSLSRWLHGVAPPPPGIEPTWGTRIHERTAAFWSWLQAFRGDVIRPPGRTPLGYRVTLPVGTFAHVTEAVHIVGLDSAWLCGADETSDRITLKDQGAIMVTDEQVEANTLDGEAALDGYRIGLVHHPLEHLADHVAVRRLLGDGGIDLLLHGHQHTPGITFVDDPNAPLRVVAAGCLMEGDLGRRWPNGFHLIEIDLATRSGSVHLRKWSPDVSDWVTATDVYRDAKDGVLHWPRAAPTPAPVTAGRPPSRLSRPLALSTRHRIVGHVFAGSVQSALDHVEFERALLVVPTNEEVDLNGKTTRSVLDFLDLKAASITPVPPRINSRLCAALRSLTYRGKTVHLVASTVFNREGQLFAEDQWRSARAVVSEAERLACDVVLVPPMGTGFYGWPAISALRAWLFGAVQWAALTEGTEWPRPILCQPGLGAQGPLEAYVERWEHDHLPRLERGYVRLSVIHGSQQRVIDHVPHDTFLGSILGTAFSDLRERRDLAIAPPSEAVKRRPELANYALDTPLNKTVFVDGDSLVAIVPGRT